MTINAVVCYLISGDKVLLIEKLRGFGAGKVNAPGGRIKPGESIIEAAKREVMEEVGLEIYDPEVYGVLEFYFGENKRFPDWRVYVLLSENFQGEPRASDEAKPFWVSIERIPLSLMWSDDRFWLPWLLDKRYFRGIFVFDEKAEALLKASVYQVSKEDVVG
ncbi:MAG TPA: 8-oxo-dGTP diphosphatase [Thermoprotei archaeon]|nr:8-oxo-dGTP diphosphatase [Thermoprotei archaeon]